MKAFVAIFILVASVLALLALHAFVAMKLYVWFIVPNFALPLVPFPYFYGFMLFVRSLNGSDPRTMVSKKYRDEGLVYLPIVEPFIVLLSGWILHLIIG